MVVPTLPPAVVGRPVGSTGMSLGRDVEHRAEFGETPRPHSSLCRASSRSPGARCAPRQGGGHVPEHRTPPPGSRQPAGVRVMPVAGSPNDAVAQSSEAVQDIP